jgi:CheY-like chemotaxis protein
MAKAKRILVIDDEDDIREVAQVSLEMVGGWEVLTAASGKEGLHTAGAQQPDAILLDVMMPDMDGPMTLQRLHSDPALQHIPVIFLTAKVQASDRQRLTALGAQGVLAKPFDPIELANQVAGVLGWG